ncbi:alpha/beta hydrolase [Actinoplanes sp. TBRC 11911]|uniref:alpha/beta fold hydrolase n=1 Tax=Actinoplanes sp. TBRC 11911 TaxID=2729386 RepID=UPI00145E7884|nr:alpha/beta hydrolase [Actinoplanes sp. TBRC 11911]NMO54515.1 alpha/beta hydrolase [Actinoplanes sp. TBRC 11911]
MTEFLSVDGGTIAYEVTGEGPLVVLAHGMGDSRASYRFVVPQLVTAGYRVANVDLRGCGESSTGWPAYSRTAIAGDLAAVIRHLGGPAVLVGQSISGGAATIVAATEPELVNGIVELAPFTRNQAIKLSDLRVKRYRAGMTRLLITGLLGSVKAWLSYLEVAYPGRRPADWDAQMDRIRREMSEPAKMKAMQKMGTSSAADAGAHLTGVRCPALIIEGSQDPDWGDPRAEGEAIVAAMPDATLELIEGAGHYPHTQYPDETSALILAFLSRTAEAKRA